MMEEFEEYYLLMRHLFLSLNDIRKMLHFEQKLLVKELKGKLKKQ